MRRAHLRYLNSEKSQKENSRDDGLDHSVRFKTFTRLSVFGRTVLEWSFKSRSSTHKNNRFLRPAPSKMFKLNKTTYLPLKGERSQCKLGPQLEFALFREYLIP